MNAVVHSAAGIGRTGTVIFVLLCLDHLAFNCNFDPFGILSNMRRVQIEIFITPLGIIEAQLRAPLNHSIPYITLVLEGFQKNP